jgi:hypothetical protein
VTPELQAFIAKLPTDGWAISPTFGRLACLRRGSRCPLEVAADSDQGAMFGIFPQQVGLGSADYGRVMDAADLRESTRLEVRELRAALLAHVGLTEAA